MKAVAVLAAALMGAAVTVTVAKDAGVRYERLGEPNLHLPVVGSAEFNATLRGAAGGDLEAFNQAEAYRFLLYSYAAYLTGSVNPWTCSYCKYTSAVSTFVTSKTLYDSATDAFGFIGYNPQFNEIVISFRGSSSLQNWILNLQFYKSQTPFGGGSGGVASGFYTFYKALQPQLTPALQALVKKYPTASIYTTGHSLGAAASSLCATDLRVNYGYNSVKVRNFGSPRVGDPTFAKYANGVVGQYMRMTHADDIVVHLPPSLFNFAHSTQEIWGTGSGYTQCSTTNGEDGSCANSVAVWEFSISDHLSYMGVSCCKGPNQLVTLPEKLTAQDKGCHLPKTANLAHCQPPRH